MKSLENLNCSYYQEVKFPQKVRQFVDVTRKSDLPILSWAEVF